jgi:hypothetical protein
MSYFEKKKKKKSVSLIWASYKQRFYYVHTNVTVQTQGEDRHPKKKPFNTLTRKNNKHGTQSHTSVNNLGWLL